MAEVSNKDLNLYDREVADAVYLMRHFSEVASNMENNSTNLRELGKRIQDAYHGIGLITEVDMTACILIDPKTGKSYPPTISIVGRVDDPRNTKQFDHDEKQFEVRDAVARGEERHRGVREKVNKKPIKNG